MDRKTQDLAWSLLPKEFKEEVKRMWSVEVDCAIKYKSELHKHRTDLLYELFGEHLHWQNNLTSDAEGEEMQMCEKSKAQKAFVNASKALSIKTLSTRTHSFFEGRAKLLLHLFGSECLPDVLSTKSDVSSSKPNPDGPKFKIGDTAIHALSATTKYKCTVVNVVQDGYSGEWEYDVLYEWGKPGMWVPESDLELSPDEQSKPEFKCKVGDRVEFPRNADEDMIGQVTQILDPETSYIVLAEDGIAYTVLEHNLTLHTEPAENPIPSNSGELKTQSIANEAENWLNMEKISEYHPHTQKTAERPDDSFNTLKDSSDEHNRLYIAAMLLSSIISSDTTCRRPIKRALELTDALIAECNKQTK